MKELILKVLVDEGKIATQIATKGFQAGIYKCLELVGIFENLKQTQLDKLKTLMQGEPPNV